MLSIEYMGVQLTEAGWFIIGVLAGAAIVVGALAVAACIQASRCNDGD